MGVRVTVPANVEAASEVNLMDDLVGPVKAEGKSVTCDLGAFQIKTLRVGLARL